MRLPAGEQNVILQPERADLAFKGGAKFPGTDNHAQYIFPFPNNFLNRFDKIRLALDRLQVPHCEDELLLQREVERLSAL